MKLHHIAIWTFRLEELKDFYVRFLGGTSNEKYINPKKAVLACFLPKSRDIQGKMPSPKVIWNAF